VLIDEVVGGHGAFRCFADAAQVFRIGETEAVSILMNSLFRANTGEFAELRRSQTVPNQIGVQIH